MVNGVGGFNSFVAERPGFESGHGHCVCFFDKNIDSDCLHPTQVSANGYQLTLGKVFLRQTSVLFRDVSMTLVRFTLSKPG